MPHFSQLSERRLQTCHQKIQSVLREVIKHIDFTVICGHRDEASQNLAFHDGRSKLRWPESKHNHNPSYAVDIAPYPIDWSDRESFYFLAGAVLATARAMDIHLIWGGRWKTLQDLPHFELRADEYEN